MNTWTGLPRAAFDLETTGRDPRTARIVTASVVVVDNKGRTRQHSEWLAAPGIPIPAEATAIHGISDETARREGREAAEVTREVSAVLSDLFRRGVPVFAFNAPYDFTVLGAECCRHGVPFPLPYPVLDPFVLDKYVNKYRRGKRTLTALCEAYGVSLEQAHASAADALATLQLADAMARQFPVLQTDARRLHDAQILWAAEQAANFQEFLRRYRPDAVVDGHWPILR